MNRQLLQFWIIITADRKKVFALCTLLLSAISLWARNAFTSGDDSRPQGTSVRADGSEGSDQSLNEGDGGDGTKMRRRVSIPPITPLSRDLFATNEEYFSSSAQTDSVDEDDAKSAPGNDDNPKAQRELAQRLLERRVRREAEELRLRSTMMGALPIAVIETKSSGSSAGVVVRVGQMIDGFRLVEVGRDIAVLEKEGVHVELGRRRQ